MKRRRRIWLRILFWTPALLVLVLAAWVAAATRPERLRERALLALRDVLADAQIDVGHVALIWPGRLEVTELRIGYGRNAALRAAHPTVDFPPVLTAAYAVIDCDPWGLLKNQVRPRRVELRGLELALVRPADQAGLDFPLAEQAADAASAKRNGNLPLPAIHAPATDVRLYVLDGEQIRLRRRWIVSLASTGAEADGLHFEARQVAGAAVSVVDATARDALFELTVGAAGVRLGTGWFDLETLGELLPRDAARVLTQGNGRGMVRVADLQIVDKRVARAELQFSEVRMALPGEDEAADLPAEQRFLQLHDVLANVRYERAGETGVVAADAAGGLNDGVVRATLEADVAEGATLREVLREFVLTAQVRQLALPTFEQHPAFVRSPRLPGPLRAFFYDYSPQGRVDCDVELRGGVAPGADAGVALLRDVRGQLVTHDAICRYHLFPYEIRGVNGAVRFSPAGIVLDGLEGHHGSARVRADGKLNNSSHWTGFDLIFRATNVPLNDELYGALPAEYRAMWERAAPLGLADVVVRVDRPEGTPEAGPGRPTTTIAARLLAGSLTLTDGRRVSEADGRVAVAAGVVRLDDVYGYDGDQAVRLEGRLPVTPAETETPPLRVAASNFRLGAERDVRGFDGAALGTLRMDARVDLWGETRGDAPAAGDFAVHVRDGLLTLLDTPPGWRLTDGWISMIDSVPYLDRLVGERGDARLEVSGTATAPDAVVAPDVHVHVRDAEMGDLLREFLPQRWSELREALGLAGAGELDLQLVRAGQGDGMEAQVRLQAAAGKPAPLPLALRDVRAELVVGSAGFRVSRVSAKYGGAGELQAHGEGGWSDASWWTDFALQGDNLKLSPELVAALPPALTRLLEKVQASGDFSLLLHDVTLRSAPERQWQFRGRIELRDAAMELGLPLEGFAGAVQGEALLRGEDQVSFAGEFTVDQGRLAGRPIERWEGTVNYSPDDPRVLLEDLRGRLCGGEVVGFARVNPQTEQYELSLTLQQIRLDELLPPRSPAAPRREGTLEGHVFVSGKTGVAGERQGGGSLRILGRRLLGPAKVVDALAGEPTEENGPLDRVEIQFAWIGDVLHFQRVEIFSEALRLVGTGSWNQRTDELELALAGAAPRGAVRVALLTDLMEVAGQQLVQYRVGGTLGNPDIDVLPLHNLTDPLRKLLGGK